MGGLGDDRATGLAILDEGTFAAAGDTNSADFPSLDPPGERKGGSDAWLSRVSWAGAAPPELAGSALWGGSGGERFAGPANVPQVGLYLAGDTSSSDFPLLNAAQAVFGGATDGFLIRPPLRSWRAIQ